MTPHTDWEKEKKIILDNWMVWLELFGKEDATKELNCHLDNLISHAVAEERKTIWEKVKDLITVWSGDTAYSVGRRVGDYLSSLTPPTTGEKENL